ncbi:YoaK family protein [Streptomyces sp. BE147]|uniref:YoaK family protein n=1 Tax=unclassified Streptomyces TaxID=2593676 RepID=UPI002E79E4C3|nr:YoaK family protein [Streptomyces sp. BE147]MEE1742114.1 YoaK family protein [Streptomyces sp. BE147]
MAVVLREAWSTVVPDPNGRHGPLPPLMLALTFVTGLVDAVSYLLLGRVFVANMTGNVVFSGFALAGAPGFSLAASLVALAAFASGALAGGLTVHRTGARTHRGRMLQYALLTETLFVTAALVVTLISGTPYSGGVRFTLIVLLGLGLGVQNAASRALAVPDLTTTVLTLTLTGVASDSRLAGGGGSRAGRRVMSAAAMLLGALAGGVAVLNGRPTLPLLLAVAVLAVASAVATLLARSGAPWTEPSGK